MSPKKQKHTQIKADAGYTQFLKSIEPITIFLLESRFRVDRDRLFKERSGKVSVAWKCVPVEVGGDYFEADASLKVKAGRATGKSKPYVEIDATFRLHLHAPKPIIRAFIDRFTDSEVRILIWPYFREYVTNITGRMSIPPVVLPLGARE